MQSNIGDGDADGEDGNSPIRDKSLIGEEDSPDYQQIKLDKSVKGAQ